MKIGLIGNMNNNNFTLMRYFRDLGEDAHLLLYSNDARGSSSHFKPECDTWDYARWKPYIHRTIIPNAPVSALDPPYSWMIWLRSVIQSWAGKHVSYSRPVSSKQINDAYATFDRLIASGISPATLKRAGVVLDIFYPYSIGVEFLRTGEFLVRFTGGLGINRTILERVAQAQSGGIRAAKRVLNAEVGITQDALDELGIMPLKIPVPMVYDQDRLPDAPPTKVLRDAWGVIASSRLTLLHQSRLMWRNPGHYEKDAWVRENKNNDWLLRGFAAFVKKRPKVNARLLIVEYGQDVDCTKVLAAELGIQSHLHWLPKMDRRELMWILSRVSVGIGEFYSSHRVIWGGTGWEALASGKPLLQGFNFLDGEFQQLYGYLPPPMLPVRSQEDILRHLLDIADNPEKGKEIGRGAKEWFNRYNGRALAEQWLEILRGSREEEMNG